MYAAKQFYTVSVETLLGETVRQCGVIGKSSATAKAEEYAIEHGAERYNVFVSFYRSQDGQTGYLNRDGFGITGMSWTIQS